MNAKPVTHHREHLQTIEGYLRDPDKGYPFAYGAAWQVAQIVVDELDAAYAEIALLREALDAAKDTIDSIGDVL